MNQLELLKQLNAEINGILERLNLNISNIEIELLRRKIVDAYDIALKLSKDELPTVNTEIVNLISEEKTAEATIIEEQIVIPLATEPEIQTEIPEQIIPEPEITNEIIGEEVAEIPEAEFPKVSEPQPEPDTQKYVSIEISEIMTTENTENEVEEPVKEESPEPEKQNKNDFSEELFSAAQEQIKKKSVLEKFSRSEPSINEKIASNKTQVPLADSVAKGPITDISKAITLNMKLSFIKELYSGDQKEYTKLIAFLTKCQNYSEAKLYIQAEQEKYQAWQQKPDLVEQLMSLITRRFRM